jgi:hypothetical protein
MFDENTTWGDVIKLAGDNVEQVDKAYKNKEISLEEFEENIGWKR